MSVQATANAVLALLLLASADGANDFADTFETDSTAGDQLTGLGAAVGGLAVLLAATAIGLSMASRWSRVVAVIICLVEVGLVAVVAADAGSNGSVAGLVLPVVILILVFTPSAGRSFRLGHVHEDAAS